MRSHNLCTLHHNQCIKAVIKADDRPSDSAGPAASIELVFVVCPITMAPGLLLLSYFDWQT